MKLPYEVDEEKELRVSASGWEDFLRSPAWLDIVDSIRIRINDLFYEFRSDVKPDNSAEVARIKYSIEVLEQIIELPEFLRDIALQSTEVKEEEEDAE